MKRLFLFLPIVLLFIASAAVFNHYYEHTLVKISKSDQREAQKHFESLLKNNEFEQLTNEFMSIYQQDNIAEDQSYNPVAASLNGFRLALFNEPKTRELIAILEKDNSLEARTAIAEILYLTAVGNNDFGGEYRQKPTKLTDELVILALELMQHDPDPFVRAIAEQAIATKVNAENDGQQLKWPKPGSNPDWFIAWQNQPAENFVQFDYVRQAMQNGVHTSKKDLAASADQWLKQTEAFSLDIINRGADRDLVKAGLEVIRDRHKDVIQATDLHLSRVAWLELRKSIREQVMLSPDLKTKDFVYVKRRNHLFQHNIANNVPMANRFPPGADILRKTDFNPANAPQSLLAQQLGTGSIRGMDLFYDADRMVFSFTPQPYTNYDTWNAFQDKADSESNLYEIKVDGSGLKQLTNDPLNADQAPAYLPNGDIVFASTRADIGSQCGPWPQHAFTMDIYKLSFHENDEMKISRISHNKDFDHYPHVLNNGMVGFTRWDYQERHFYYPHTIWGCRPDGTQSDLIYKSHLSDGPHSLRDAMPIPNSDKLFAIACGHHSIPEGALALIDLDSDLNDPSSVSYVTPYASETEGGYGEHAKTVPEGGVRDAIAMGMGGFYQTPWPLSERGLLISAMYGGPISCGSMIYYVDVFGNKELLARDLIYELLHPKLVQPRTKPPVLPDVTDPEKLYASLYINDVYDGLEGVERGAAKYVRISSKVNWPYAKGDDQYGVMRWFVDQGSSPTFGFYNWSPTRVLGIVPVEEDGSAYFKAPVEMALSFELLDKDLRQIRRMRSHVEFMRGETRGCIGCHETHAFSTNVQPKRMMALKREPSIPQPPSYEGGDRVLLDYVKHVQPVFDNNCVSCHGIENPAAGIEFSSRPDSFGFLQSYRSLFGFSYEEKLPVGGDWWYETYFPEAYDQYALKMNRKIPREERKANRELYEQIVEGSYPGQLVTVISRRSDAEITQPYQAGSYNSKLIMHLYEDKEHAEIRRNMKPEAWEALVTFIDNNAPATGWFYAKRDQNGNTYTRTVNDREIEDLRRVYVRYPDPWNNRKPNDENGEPQWPAVPTRVQTLVTNPN